MVDRHTRTPFDDRISPYLTASDLHLPLGFLRSNRFSLLLWNKIPYFRRDFHASTIRLWCDKRGIRRETNSAMPRNIFWNHLEWIESAITNPMIIWFSSEVMRYETNTNWLLCGVVVRNRPMFQQVNRDSHFSEKICYGSQKVTGVQRSFSSFLILRLFKVHPTDIWERFERSRSEHISAPPKWIQNQLQHSNIRIVF
jgi:hypothetical protein